MNAGPHPRASESVDWELAVSISHVTEHQCAPLMLQVWVPDFGYH